MNVTHAEFGLYLQAVGALMIEKDVDAYDAADNYDSISNLLVAAGVDEDRVEEILPDCIEVGKSLVTPVDELELDD